MKVALILLLLFLLIPKSVIASTQNKISSFESRLERVVKILDRVDAPIEQMGPKAGAVFDSAYEDVQSSVDEITERLEMIKFIDDHAASAPADKRELASDELKFMSADIEEIEQQTILLAQKVNSTLSY